MDLIKKKFNLLYFGDNCGPGILISWLFNFNTPLPFQLMVTNAKAINEIIQDDFKYIIEKEYLLDKDKKSIEFFENDINKYNHESMIYHSKYDIIINHDFYLKDGKILNYNFIKKSWDDKIKNFNELIADTKYKFFINFPVFKIDLNDHINFLELVKSKYSASNVYILIFNPLINENHIKQNIYLIKLDIYDYNIWWNDNLAIKYDSMLEIYTKFCNIINTIDDFDIPPFESSWYYKNYIDSLNN